MLHEELCSPDVLDDIQWCITVFVRNVDIPACKPLSALFSRRHRLPTTRYQILKNVQVPIGCSCVPNPLFSALEPVGTVWVLTWACMCSDQAHWARSLWRHGSFSC